VLYWCAAVSGDGKEGISSDMLLAIRRARLVGRQPPAISPKAPYVVEHSDTYTL